MNWDDLRYLLAVHRTGSHKRAARQLGVAATTVSRRLLALGQAVGVPLFLRTAGGLTTTAAATALLARAERVEAEVIAAGRELAGVDARMEGPLRVTAGDGLVNHVIVPALGELLAAHPALAFELRADTQVLDLSRREADVAIRLVRPREPALIARRLGEMRFGLFASERYLERRGVPRTHAALRSQEWVGFEAALDRLPQVRWLRRLVPGLRYAVRANNTTTQLVACAEGLGVALLPVASAAREPRLVPLLPRQPGPSRELWGVTHADLRGSPRVTLFLDWLARAVQAASR